MTNIDRRGDARGIFGVMADTRFKAGRAKTGGKTKGSRNRIPSKKRVQQRLLAQVHASLERHAAVIEQMYRTDPLEAGKLDARVNRDAIELLGMSERLSGGGGQRSSTSEKQIEAAATKAGAITDAHEAARLYDRLIAAVPGSDEARIAAARIALGRRAQLGAQFEAIAAAAGLAVEQVQAVLDAVGTVLDGLPKLAPMSPRMPDRAAMPIEARMPRGAASADAEREAYERARRPSGCVDVSRLDDDVPILMPSPGRTRAH